MTQNCTTCLHSLKVEQGALSGWVCRRFPPSLLVNQVNFQGLTLSAHFPPVSEAIYCFEYRPRPVLIKDLCDIKTE